MWRLERAIASVVCVLLSLVAHSVMAECVAATPQLEHMQHTQIRLQSTKGEWITVDARIADEPAESAAGFQHICPETIDQTFILFVYPRPYLGRFHMQNVYAPLDIAFIRGDGTLVSIQQMRAEPPGSPVKPRLYSSPEPFMYALEARANFFAENNIEVMRSSFDVDTFRIAQ